MEDLKEALEALVEACKEAGHNAVCWLYERLMDLVDFIESVAEGLLHDDTEENDR